MDRKEYSKWRTLVTEKLDRHWFVKLLYQRLIVMLLIIAQLIIFIYLGVRVSQVSAWIGLALRVFSWFMVIFIILSPKVLDYKLTWIVLVLAFPLVGGILFAFLNTNLFNRRLKREVQGSLENILPFRRSRDEVYTSLAKVKDDEFALANYIHNTTSYPLYVGGGASYQAEGEIMFESMMEEIAKAKKYIFLEFFIVDKGVMLETLMDALAKKADEGVEVLFLYDDMGTMFRLPSEVPKRMSELGITAKRFNHLIPVLSTQFNNRDHRKIVVIDGEVAFTGGINIADEYINEKERFGHWKDGGVLFTGEAAWGMALMFLELWNATSEEQGLMSEEQIRTYCPDPAYLNMEVGLTTEEKAIESFIQPFGDSPFDLQFVGRMVYKKLIYNADHYLYITTPYLVLDDDMVESICQAAQSGVDVRIITPHIWDKAYVRMVSRSYYRKFIDAGVRIFEYTPGFIHAKTLVSDDLTAVIGTINFDYRSLYLHFEDAVVVYNQECVKQVYDDFLKTQALSHEVHLNEIKLNVFQRALAGVLRLFSPLM